MRERVYVVDELDNIIGEKWRDELENNDCWRIIAVWVIDQNGNVLLQQRSKHKKIGPGVWTAGCEGTVEKDHDPLETAVRELNEELGLKVSPDKLVATHKLHYDHPILGWRICSGYILKIDHKDPDDFTIQKSEVAQLKWFTIDELKEFLDKNPGLLSLFNIYKQLGFLAN